jgi:hypothetical protein
VELVVDLVFYDRTVVVEDVLGRTAAAAADVVVAHTFVLHQ